MWCHRTLTPVLKRGELANLENKRTSSRGGVTPKSGMSKFMYFSFSIRKIVSAP